MTGKIFRTIFCVLNIGIMQLAVLGCLTKRDCSTGSRKQMCCYFVQPPRCMARFLCYFAQRANITKASFLPDYNNNYDNYNNGYNSSDSTSSSPDTITGIVLLVVILLLLFIFGFRCLRLQPGRRNDVCVVRPPLELTTYATSRTNLVSQESERPSLVTIAIRPDEGVSVSENLPPEGESPFLSEDEILQSLQTPSGSEPPSLDPPKYEELPLLPYDTAQVPNPSLNGIPIQPNVDLPAVNPPSYDE